MKEHRTKILTFLIPLTFGLTAVGQECSKETLKGRVKFITIFGYDASEKPGQKQTDKPTTKATLQYDEKGNLIETNHFDIKTNTVFSTERSTYDDRGNRLEITFYNGIGDVNAKYVYKYDSRNHEIEKSTFWKGRYDGKVVTNYDYTNMLVKVEFYNAVGIISSKHSYKIDNKGNHLEDYDSQGVMFSKSSFIYDDKERITREHSESWEEEHTKAIVEHQYDIWGNEVRHTCKDADGKKIISANYTEYIYDKFGNWIKSIRTYSSNSIRGTAIREIEYY